MQYQNSIINDNVLDFEEHKKLLEQLVKENSEIQNEVRMMKFQDLPVIKQMINMRSVNTESKPEINQMANTVTTISQFTNIKDSSAENADANIGSTYYMRHPIMHEMHLNVKVHSF